jgi:hypothetical protein
MEFYFLISFYKANAMIFQTKIGDMKGLINDYDYLY